jgi:hypothetical protein
MLRYYATVPTGADPSESAGECRAGDPVTRQRLLLREHNAEISGREGAQN